MVDIDYYTVLYNMANGVGDDVARLVAPQRYVRLLGDDGLVCDLEVVRVSEHEVLLGVVRK